MSTDQPANADKPRPEASSEQREAFRGVYSRLSEFSQLHGQPIVLIGRSYVGIKADVYHDLGLVFDADARRFEPWVRDAEGVAYPTYGVMLGEGASQRLGSLGRLVVYRDIVVESPVDVYTLHPDANIESISIHLTPEDQYNEYTAVNPDLRTKAKNFEWMNAQQMSELGTLINTAEFEI